MYGGAAASLVLLAVSPAVSGSPSSLLPGADFAYFPWTSVGIVSIPLGFVFGWLGASLDRERTDTGYAVMEVRALTGAGAAEAVPAAAAPARASRFRRRTAARGEGLRRRADGDGDSGTEQQPADDVVRVVDAGEEPGSGDDERQDRRRPPAPRRQQQHRRGEGGAHARGCN